MAWSFGCFAGLSRGLGGKGQRPLAHAARTRGCPDPKEHVPQESPNHNGQSADAGAEELLALLPGLSGIGEQLRLFWAAFVALDFRRLAEPRCSPCSSDAEALDRIRQRCSDATRPFELALYLLVNQTEACRCREDLYSEWNAILAVKRLLGHTEISAPAREEVRQAIDQSRARYLRQARAFKFIASALRFRWPKPGDGDVRAKAEALILVQAAVPSEWRKPGNGLHLGSGTMGSGGLDSLHLGSGAMGAGGLDTCWGRS